MQSLKMPAKKIFKDEWKTSFFFVPTNSGDAQCVICTRVISLKKYNMELHYRKVHSDYELYLGDERKTRFADLESRLINSESTEPREDHETTIKLECDELMENKGTKLSPYNMTRATYVISLELCKQCRPFTDGIMFQHYSSAVLKYFKDIGEDIAEPIESIPLSARTIRRRIEETSKYLHSKFIISLKNCKYFSISLDKSVDLKEVEKMIICVKTVNEHFVCEENLLCLITFQGHTNAAAMYSAVAENVFKHVDKSKLSSVCTHGSPVMVSQQSGLVGELEKNGIRVPTFHSIIHQEALFSKSENLLNTMKDAINIFRRIRSEHNPLKHTRFVPLLSDLNAEYGDLFMFNEVQWLSQGSSLKMLFDLRADVLNFLMEENCVALADKMSDLNFIADLAYLVDVSSILNRFHLVMQSRNRNIFQLVAAVQLFMRSLTICINELRNNNLQNFENLQQCDYINSLAGYANNLEHILTSIDKRFQDIHQINTLKLLFENPMSCEINHFDPELTLELERLQLDATVPLESGLEFWKGINDETYPKLKNTIYRLFAMFGSTRICELAYATMKQIQSRLRNRLTHENMENLLRIKCFEGDIDIDGIISR